jgi:hypothetical protein
MSGRRQADLCGLGFRQTLPAHARSTSINVTMGGELDIYKHNPWRAPGFAPERHDTFGQKGTTLPPLETGTRVRPALRRLLHRCCCCSATAFG